MDKVVGQPFSANLERQADAAGIGLKLDYARLDTILKGLPESRGLEVLKYQINRYHDVIPELRDEKIIPKKLSRDSGPEL